MVRSGMVDMVFRKSHDGELWGTLATSPIVRGKSLTWTPAVLITEEPPAYSCCSNRGSRAASLRYTKRSGAGTVAPFINHNPNATHTRTHTHTRKLAFDLSS